MSRHSHRWARLAAALALAGLATLATVAGAGEAAPAAAAAPATPSQAAPVAPVMPPAPPVRLAFWLGRDFGTTTLVTVSLSDGSTVKLKANEGLILAVGAVFLPLLDGTFETQATIGYKRASIEATNGSIVLSSIPIEVLEAWHAGPVRLAAGLSLQLASSVTGSGAAGGLDTSFEPSLGLVLQAQWVWRLGQERRWRLELGGRFTWQALRLSDARQTTTDANAVGIVLGAAY